MKTNSLSFTAWMRQVDQLIQARTGCSADDLPDFCYRDMYDDGVSPRGAAAAAIRNAKDE